MINEVDDSGVDACLSVLLTGARSDLTNWIDTIGRSILVSNISRQVMMIMSPTIHITR